jgi:hypothetical protein
METFHNSQIIQKKQEVKYLVREKMSKGMVFTFIGSFMLILVITYAFFYYFLNFTLVLSVESIFYSHIY